MCPVWSTLKTAGARVSASTVYVSLEASSREVRSRAEDPGGNRTTGGPQALTGGQPQSPVLAPQPAAHMEHTMLVHDKRQGAPRGPQGPQANAYSPELSTQRHAA
jgi:hypothetical protein